MAGGKNDANDTAAIGGNAAINAFRTYEIRIAAIGIDVASQPGLVLYGRAVSILEASGGAAFPALCPAMTAVLAIPILGEWPTAIDWIAIILISAGVYVVSGGPVAPATDVKGAADEAAPSQ